MDISIFDTGPVAIFVWDGQRDDDAVHPLVFATPNCPNILGYTHEELISRKVEYSDLIHKDDIKRVLQNIEKYFVDQKTVSFTDNYRVHKKDGSVIWVSDHSELKFNNDGDLTKITGYVSDITELIQIRNEAELLKIERAAAEKAAETKMQFLANMSHEIRTPMNGIIGLSDILAMSELNDSQSKIVDTIQRSGHALTTIINDILDFSKIEANQIELEQAPFNLLEAIEDVMQLLCTGASDKDIDLMIQYSPDLPKSFIGDIGRMRQVFTNLVGNALKFTHSGHVLVDVSGVLNDRMASLKISVEDTGIGIPANKREVIFEKFSQADISTTREYGGTGLGLSISRNLIDIMGGTMELESEVNVGSKFTIDLDLPLAVCVEKSPQPLKTFEKLNVVMIDDNPTNLNILKTYFSQWNCKTVGIERPKIGIKLLETAMNRQHRIDLIILDYQMEGMSGADVYRHILTLDAYKDTPVIFLTSAHSDQIHNKLLSLGASKVLNKPIISDSLKMAVAKALRPRNQTSLRSLEYLEKKYPVISHNDQPKILIAEDNIINQTFYKHAFQQLGLDYHLVDDGQKAVDYWKTNELSLIIMDVSMPNMNGYEATQKIRMQEKLKNIPYTPILGVSAHVMNRHREDAVKAGMDDYITKPINILQFKEKLMTFVDDLDAGLEKSA